MASEFVSLGITFIINRLNKMTEISIRNGIDEINK